MPPQLMTPSKDLDIPPSTLTVVITSSQHVTVELLLLAESEHIEGVLRVLKLFVVVDRVHLGLALEIG